MSPPASSREGLASAKKAKKPHSKEERKHKKKGEHERAATDDEAFVPFRDDNAPDGKRSNKRKQKDGREGKERGKKPRKEREAGGGVEEEERPRGDDKMRRAMEDERFAAARTDPRFRPMRRKEEKVALDSRFSSMLTDPRFAPSAAPVDKRGRRRKKGARENPMLQYYLNQEEEEGRDNEKKEKGKLIKEVEEEEVQDEEQDDEENSSSSDEDEDENELDDDEYSVGSDIAHYLMGRHDDTPVIDKETHRLAVVNMDWDHIKAVDLYMVMTSCLPKGGRVLSVSVYPSEFGLKCMEIESTKGPAALVDVNEDDDEDNDSSEDDDFSEDDKDGSEHDSEADNKLRAYELNRLRYYNAVVVCDSSATANHLYTNLDGTELLKTANVFDLQFIPDSMEFKHPARDIATEAPANYKEPNFETRALQHSRVKLSWDEDEPERKKVLRRKFTDDQLDELHVYLASDDSASDDDDLDNDGNVGGKEKLTKEERLAILLQRDKSDEEQTDGQDMEITFNPALEDLSKRILENKSNEKTVWEKHQEKMKEKRKGRKKMPKDDDDRSSEDDPDEGDDFFDEEDFDDEIKPTKKQKAKAKDKRKGKGKDTHTEEHMEQEATKEELELLVAADENKANGAKGYNLKRKNSKKGKKGRDESLEDKLPEIDLSKDNRFSEMFTSHLFALDPTDPQYKRSAAFLRKQAGKQRAHAGMVDGEAPVERSSARTDEEKPDRASTEKLQISSAVKSLKRNLAALKNASKSDR